MKELAKRLQQTRGMSESQLYLYWEFYLRYPQIFLTVSGKLKTFGLEELSQKAAAQLPTSPVSTTPASSPSLNPDILLTRLSFSHFIELFKAESPLKQAFYDVQAIKNNWTVRELKRAMSTLLFERTGLSTDKQAVIAQAKDQAPIKAADLIRNPFLLEFLGLEEKSQYSESDLEEAIITHLQQFLMELGRGFCFEVCQKSITFDNEHYRLDLVFYHRILKCHVLIDLKIGPFSHADAGQMNVYLNYYAENERTEGDNPPIGIILCAHKNDSLVRYATGGLPQEVFVSKYLLELPSIEELKRLIDADTIQLDEGAKWGASKKRRF